MCEGVQETVRLGLLELARKVKEGAYGKGDAAFGGEEDCDGEVFLADMHDYVIDKME